MPESLPAVFRARVEQIIARDTSAADGWRMVTKDGGAVELTVPKLSPDGFDITVIADAGEVSVYTEHLAHQHYVSAGDHAEACELGLGLLRDLLAPGMRVRVVEVGGQPCRASFEVLRRGEWQDEGTTGLFVLSWFRRKTERLYINRRLAPRAPNAG